MLGQISKGISKMLAVFYDFKSKNIVLKSININRKSSKWEIYHSI